jgi:hypothetical protein
MVIRVAVLPLDDWVVTFLGNQAPFSPREISGVETFVSYAIGYRCQKSLDER